MVKIEKWRIKTGVYPLNKKLSFLNIRVFSDPYMAPTMPTYDNIPYGYESLYL